MLIVCINYCTSGTSSTAFPHLIPDCEALRDQFEPVFAQFSRCHSIFDKSEVHGLDDLGITCKIYTYTCPPKLLQRMPSVPSSPLTAGCFQKHQLLSHARRESCIFPLRVEWHRLRCDGRTGVRVHSLMHCFAYLTGLNASGVCSVITISAAVQQTGMQNPSPNAQMQNILICINFISSAFRREILWQKPPLLGLQPTK